jgi:cell division protein FtsN
MVKDFKNNRKTPNKPLPGWVWMLTGIALGLIVAFFVYLDSQRAIKQTRLNSFTMPGGLQQNAVNQEQSPPTKRKFDFYTLLPELEVLVPESPRQETYPSASPDTLPTEVPRPDKKEPTVSTPSTAYLLQVGSFQKHGEADSLKAQLALLGVESNIQTVNVDKSTWHRVRVGPYRDRQRLNQIRVKLRKNNIDSMLMMARQ